MTLVGPFRSAASADAPLHKEAFSSSLVQMDIGLPALQVRFLVTSCLAGACVADWLLDGEFWPGLLIY